MDSLTVAIIRTSLTHFTPMCHFYSPWNFSTLFSGGTEMNHQPEISLPYFQEVQKWNFSTLFSGGTEIRHQPEMSLRPATFWGFREYLRNPWFPFLFNSVKIECKFFVILENTPKKWLLTACEKTFKNISGGGHILSFAKYRHFSANLLKIQAEADLGLLQHPRRSALW